MSLTWIWISATAGVALSAAFSDVSDWLDVIERSYFMGSALFVVWLRDRYGFGKGKVRGEA